MNDLYIDLSVLLSEPAEVYHAQAGQYLSSHALADFRKCPQLFIDHRRGLLANLDRPAYLLGRAAHVRILEGRERYAAEFAVGGPLNEKTGKPYGAATKAWAEWAEKQGKPVLAAEQAELVESLVRGVGANSVAIDLIVDGVAEGVVRADYCGVPCQARLDWLNPYKGIVDLKTADDLTWFEADARRYGYVYQMAFYRAVLAQAIGGTLAPVHLIAVEKKAPFRCGVWRLAEDALAQAQKENEAAIGRLKACDQRDVWPTGYEDVRLLDVS